MMNFLVLPLYRRADAVQEATRDREKELAPGIQHIKKTFSGNERMMMLQTYYKQNHYSPLSAFSGSISLLLEIPFFLAAYQFLSNLALLDGASLGPIENLGAPDQLLTIGTLSINVLPVLMTLINFGSAAIYLRGFPLKTKIRTYAIAVVFLVLLYKSPSGLVFYWTLNNVFSLLKNLVLYVILPHAKKRKEKKAQKKVAAADAAETAGAAAAETAGAEAAGAVMAETAGAVTAETGAETAEAVTAETAAETAGVVMAETASETAAAAEAGNTVLSPANTRQALRAEKKRIRTEKKQVRAAKKQVRAEKRAAKKAARPAPKTDWKIFVISCLFLTILVGAFIPSVYISASPQEYVSLKYWFNPIWYNISALLLSAGLFLLWFGVFYRLAGPRGRVIFERVMVILALLGIINYMFFGTKLGMLSASLRYEGGIAFETTERILNGVVIAAVIAMVVTLAGRFPKAFRSVFAAGALALVVMSAINTGKSRASLKEIDTQTEEEAPQAELTFTRSGKNVAILFLDRAIGEYIPCFIKEKPEFARLFDGFTYYSNVISYGGHTNMGAPALMGGYEYTPVEMNRRDTEKMKDKHNEAVKMLPVLFSHAGYGVTVCDAPYANYKWIPDLSIFDPYPNIRKYLTKGTFGTEYDQMQAVQNNLRNFFMFSLMKTMPLELQPEVYDSGSYLIAGGEDAASMQFGLGRSRSRGLNRDFMDSYEVLRNLSRITTIEDKGPDQYLFFYNDAPHTPVIVKEPEYVPEQVVDNTEFDETHMDRFEVNGKTLDFSTRKQMSHYESDMAALLKVGEWFDYLRENGVYDNTRIIIVADHGFYVGHDKDRIFEREDRDIDTTGYYPLLMVKDFNATGFTTSDTFMTNADVPSLAVQDLIEDARNPFTGKEITMDEKTAHDQFIMTSKDYATSKKDTTFTPSGWAVITNNINDRDDWQFIDEEIVLKEHAIPEED